MSLYNYYIQLCKEAGESIYYIRSYKKACESSDYNYTVVQVGL